MRRKDRELADPAEIAAVVSRADSVRIALKDEPYPYLVALSFGYEAGRFYFHCARTGRKLDLMRADPRVAFQLDASHRLQKGPLPCDWGMAYESVAGEGKLSELTEPAEARKGLDLIMEKYGAEGPFDYDPRVLEATCVLRLDISSMTGKRKASRV